MMLGGFDQYLGGFVKVYFNNILKVEKDITEG